MALLTANASILRRRYLHMDVHSFFSGPSDYRRPSTEVVDMRTAGGVLSEADDASVLMVFTSALKPS